MGGSVLVVLHRVQRPVVLPNVPRHRSWGVLGILDLFLEVFNLVHIGLTVLHQVVVAVGEFGPLIEESV